MKFVVDGMELAPDDFADLFSSYEGFEMHYAVREPSIVFTNDMTLYPVKMDEASFGDELTKLLMALSDKHEGKFIGKNEVPMAEMIAAISSVSLMSLAISVSTTQTYLLLNKMFRLYLFLCLLLLTATA